MVLMVLLSTSAALAQSTANYTFATSSTGSLVDMSTGTTDALATGTYRDDDASAVQPIGFTFGFMGINYTQFSVNSNGQLRLGATAISGGNATPTAGAAILGVFGGDNATQATGAVRYKVVPGTNRTLVVEWTGLRVPYAGDPAAGTPTQVQVILEENTGKVEYRYGTVFNNSTSTTTRSIFISAGTSAGQIGVVTTFVTTPTYNSTATSATTSTLPANAAVPVLSSTADGSRTTFTFTPVSGMPAAPAVATTAVGQASLNLVITDNSTNETYFTVSRSTDNITFATVGSVLSTTTAATGGTVTFAQTGLTPGTTYYYRVTANNEAGGTSTTATATATTGAAVPVCGTKSVGPGAGADYASLTAAFAAVTINGLCGPLVLELQASYVSTVETFPLVYNYAGGSATNTVTVRPAAGATNLSITSTVTGAAFNIFGGKYLIVDGRPGGSGSTVSGAALATDLTIASTSTTGIPLQFTSDATFNTVQHTQVIGVGNNVSSYPNVNFTGTTTTLGNSDNILQYNTITAGATTPVTLIYSGSSLNSRNSIIGNNMSNFYLSGGSSYGLHINTAGTGWIISGNSVYQTASRASTSGTMYGLYIIGGGGHTVTGNFIGGTAPNAGGTPLTATGTAAAFRFSGIFLTLSGAATSVQGNTVANINWVSSSGASTTYGIVSGIYISAGDANIGTVTGNTIGTATGPITVSTSTSGGYSFGISSNSSGTVAISGNTISNITGVGSSATVASNVAGILVSAGTTTTVNRNKIYALAAGSGVGNISTGIWLTGGTTNNVNNNLIGDLQASTSTSLVGVSGLLIAGGTTNSVYYNTINLAATSTGATFGTSGIYLNSTTASADLRNNIVVNKSTAVGTGGYTAALRRVSGTAGTAPANLASTSNNNLYYAGTPSATNLIYVEGTTTATNAAQTLADYKALVSTRESLSQTEDVAFLSTTGSSASFLHINPAVATLAEGKAQPISGITVDFDNDTRSGTTPDIGADEGTFITAAAAVDVAATGLVSPSAAGCYGATESVVVSVRNNGTQALNFATNPLTVTVNVTGAATQTLTITVNTGTLAVGASQNVTVGTLNMTAAGTYSFAIVATATGDGDASNDNTTATRTKVAIATGPQFLNFTGFTGANLTALYPGWYEATGLTLPTGTTSTWTSDDYANVVNGPNGISAKINLFTTTRNDWIVSPRVLATASSVLTYDLALTAFAATTTGTLGSDDRLEVRVSTDCGLSFTTIKSYTASTPISNTGQAESISLASYAGQEIIVAFFATEGTVDDTNDNDLFIDNISLNPQAVDLAATALVSPASGQGCYSTAESVVVSVRNAGAQTLDFAANPATVTVAVTGAVTQTLTGTVNTGTLAAGASQNVTVAPTLDMSAAGTYTFTISATVTGDQNTTNDALPAAVTRTVVAPVAGTVAPTAATLCVSGTVTLTLTGSANGTIQWQQSTDNVTFTDISGANAATYTTPVLTSTTYFRARTICNTTVATSNVTTITISNPQATTTNSPVAVCEGSTATLTATAATGTTLQFFETATGGTALTSTGGTFTTPALTTSRQYFVEATSSGVESLGRPAPAATTATTAVSYGLVFTAANPFTLNSVEVYPTGAAGNLVVQVQDNNGTLIPGLTATVAVPAGTTAANVPFTVPLNFNIPAGTGLRLIAVSSPSLVREASVGGFPYTSPSGAVSITNGYISGTSTTYYFFYNWQITTSCTGTRTAIQVNVTPAATASFPAATATSCGISPYTLAGSVGGSATTGTYTSSGTGTFSPNATTLNATYTPSAADVAAGSVTITLTSNATSPCTGATATLALSISPAPVATFSYPAATTYCAGSTSTVTPTLGTGATAGVFSSTTGLTVDAATGVITLATSTAGTYTVTNTIAASGACAAVTATATVTITPAASAAFNYASSTLCLSGTNPTPTVTGTAGGTFSSTTGLSINATTGAINLAASTAGTYVVTYTVAGTCGSSATQTLTLTTAPIATFSYATTSACAGSATLLTPTLGTGASAGVFTSTTGLTINAATGAVNPATSTAGTYTVTNTIAASGACAAATATATVTINALPATPTYTYTYPTSSTVLFTSSVAPAGTTYQWYVGTTAITGATSQTYTANGVTAPGSYTVRFINTATGCQSAASTPLTVTATNQALAGSSLSLFPNPTADGKLTLQLSGYTKAVTLTVIDALGRVVLVKQVAAGQSEAKLDLSGAASGVYTLRAVTEGGADVRRIVRE
jgi:hypothetical protein